MKNAPAQIEQLLKTDELEFDSKIDITLYKCESCQVIQQLTSPLPAGYYDHYDQKASDVQSMAAYQKSLAVDLVKRFDWIGKSVFEIGTGDGFFAHQLQEFGVNVFGVEPGQPSVEAARHLGLSVQRGYFGASLELPTEVLPHTEYDAIISRQVISHVPDLYELLKKAIEVTKPGGHMIFECPDASDALSQHRYYDLLPDYFSYLTPSSMSALALKFGLEIVDVSLRRDGEYFLIVLRKPADQSAEQLFAMWRDELCLTLQPFFDRDEKVVFWGAGGRGTMLLSIMEYGIGQIPCVFDGADTKIGKYTPGSNIPVLDAARFNEIAPNCVVITPVKFQKEIVANLRENLGFTGSLVGLVPFPHLIDSKK